MASNIGLNGRRLHLGCGGQEDGASSGAPLDAAKRAFDAMMEMKKIDIAAIKAARRG